MIVNLLKCDLKRNTIISARMHKITLLKQKDNQHNKTVVES